MVGVRRVTDGRRQVTKAVLSKMSRWVPSQEDVLVFISRMTNDEQSRSSRGQKGSASGDAVRTEV